MNFIKLMCVLLFGTLNTYAAKNPNIIIIMVDDLGAESVGCYGNTAFLTPNIDRLAKEGARFENAYGTPSCSPSRAMILTGLDTNRSGIIERLGTGTVNHLPSNLPNFSHMLKDNGYKTAIAGKWHLGDFDQYPEYPKAHGFDEYFMWASYYDEVETLRFYNPVIWHNQEIKEYKGKYGPDLYCDFLLKFIEKNKDVPFLAYYPMTLVHKPFHNPPELGGKIKHALPNDATSGDKKFGLMISYTDYLVGKVLNKIDELGIRDNTIVIFTADNGTPAEITSRLGNLKVSGGKLHLKESGWRIPYIARWPKKIPVGVRENFFSHADLLPTLTGLIHIPMKYDVSGIDLSHNFFKTKGKDRMFLNLAWEGGYYMARNRDYELHENDDFFKVPITSNEERYGENKVDISTDEKAYKLLKEQIEDNKSVQRIDTTFVVIPFKGFKKYRVKPSLKKGKDATFKLKSEK